MHSDRFIIFLMCIPFLLYQGQGHLLKPRSNIKVTLKKQEGHDGPGVAHLSLPDCDSKI